MRLSAPLCLSLRRSASPNPKGLPRVYCTPHCWYRRYRRFQAALSTLDQLEETGLRVPAFLTAGKPFCRTSVAAHSAAASYMYFDLFYSSSVWGLAHPCCPLAYNCCLPHLTCPPLPLLPLALLLLPQM